MLNLLKRTMTYLWISSQHTTHLGHRHDDEEKQNKIQGFGKKIPASWTRLSDLC
jgi:hypothetical protein